MLIISDWGGGYSYEDGDGLRGIDEGRVEGGERGRSGVDIRKVAKRGQRAGLNN